MKRLFGFIFGLSVLLIFNGTESYAQKGQGGGQGRGANAGPPVNRGPGANAGQRNRADRVEDRLDRREDRLDRREDRTDRREDRIDRREDRLDPRDMTMADRINRNPRLADRVQKLLPAGTNVASAASGFKNQGQFIAALHVSRNLNVPFNDLKAKMTGADAKPLGQAIQELRPEMSQSSIKTEARKAEREAKKTESLN
jgi:hypothetical protein